MNSSQIKIKNKNVYDTFNFDNITNYLNNIGLKYYFIVFLGKNYLIFFNFLLFNGDLFSIKLYYKYVINL